MRQRLIVGNWKMFTTAATARRLAAHVVRGLGPETRGRVALCPPAPYLGVVGEVVSGTAVALGAQNVYPEKEGAFTGETGIGMLLDLGCRFVIVGHSERRHKFGESDPFINRKVQAALAAVVEVIGGHESGAELIRRPSRGRELGAERGKGDCRGRAQAAKGRQLLAFLARKSLQPFLRVGNFGCRSCSRGPGAVHLGWIRLP
jgi:hypothetical protein